VSDAPLSADERRFDFLAAVPDDLLIDDERRERDDLAGKLGAGH
jgi:hypothetical protein